MQDGKKGENSPVKFHICEDITLDDEESYYLNQACSGQFEPPIISTDEDSEYSMDRLNSSDFFDAPEVDIILPRTRAKRLSLEKKKHHSSSSQDEKDSKRRLQIAREKKAFILKTSQSFDTQPQKKKTTKSESKLRHQSRSQERDLKPASVSEIKYNSDNERTDILLQKDTPASTAGSAQAGSLKEETTRRPPLSPSSARRRISDSNSQQSMDGRKKFHKSLVLKLKLGKRAYQEREDKSRTMSTKYPFQRQYSDIIYNCRNEMSHEHLFVSLQAHRKKLERDDCYNKMLHLKERIPDKLDALNNFEFVPESDSMQDISSLLSDPFNISDDYLYDVEDAIDKVKEILESIETIQSLFPTYKSMSKDFEECGSFHFRKKMCTLNMWLTNATGLMSALKTAGSIAGVQKLPYVRWPFMEPNELNTSVNTQTSILSPNVASPGTMLSYTLSPEVSSSTNAMTINNSSHKKKVKFDATSPLSSSPGSGMSPLQQDGLTQYLNDKHNSLNSSFNGIEICNTPTGFYRPAVDKLLRKTGLQQMIQKKAPQVVKPLLKAKFAIKKMELSLTNQNKQESIRQLKHYDVLALSANYDIVAMDLKVEGHESVDEEFGSLYDEFTSMKLPSLMPMYIFLSRFLLDLTHESVKLRIEQKIDRPSLPILRQVVHECSEAAKVAISIKQTYQYFLSPVIKKFNITDEVFERYIESFNYDLNLILEDYFHYVDYGMEVLHKEAFPVSLKSFLEEEWSFSKEICPFITGGMAEAGKRFCGMASVLLSSIHNKMEQKLDESLFKSSSSEYASDSPSSPQTETECDSSSISTDGFCTPADYRQMLMRTCREIKSLFTEIREETSKALAFTKLLRKDLETAAEFKIITSNERFFDALRKSGHIRVEVSHAYSYNTHTHNYAVFVPSVIKDDTHSILTLLDVTCGREDLITDPAVAPSYSREGYLLLVNIGDKHVWSGHTINLEPKSETAIALSHIEVPASGLFLMVIHSSQLHRQNKVFNDFMSEEVALLNEQTTCHQAIAEAWEEVRGSAFSLARGIKEAIQHVENQLESTDLTSLDSIYDRKNIEGTNRETLHQCYAFGFEFLQEFNRLTTSSGQTRKQKDDIILGFTNQWIKFVLDKCERGKGTRPKWASPGFDFLGMAIDPSITKNFTNEEFDELKNDVDKVVRHIIGEVQPSRSHQTLVSHKKNKPVTPTYGQHRFLSEADYQTKLTRRQTSSGSNGSRIGSGSEPPTPIDLSDSCPVRYNSRESFGSMGSTPSIPESPSFSSELLPPDRAQAAVAKLDHHRDELLRQKHVIGKVMEGHHREVNIRINVKRVNFKWQRGFKLGEGMYGVVYTAINCDTEEMMAMKEIRFQPNDVQTIKLISDEIKTFESINHPNLVKYFGVEVHKEEMFIFMEYCNEGTLELKSKMGLTESLIRRYTRELVIAVEFLHDHNIVHRDIKGANIFLVSNDKLKLGDFGCSAKLKGHTTMPGEMVQFVGTAAYMAPEVIVQKGHGRAADIWSLGCVVLEMVTGKRPWHELENYHQIMFKVGTGNIPCIPDTFHSEGQDFLKKCFETEPSERSTANELLGHIFTKVLG